MKYKVLANNVVTASLLAIFLHTRAQSSPSNSSNLSKRGLLYIGSDHPSDYNIFTSSGSPLTWYYNYSPGRSLSSSDLEFVAMIHGADSAESDVASIRSQSSIGYVLVYNEPDGSTDSGGSNVSPSEAARTYLDTILPLRTDHGKKLSLPATTGSGNGLDWLRRFNESCHDLNPRIGCPFDFVAAHWYGDFAAMASWLGTLHAMYPGKPVWLTEFALPQQDVANTQAMLNQSLPFLDSTGWIERYAWFGAFREDDANEWTGDGVSMLQKDGGLTQLGATYLGGGSRGFDEGDGAGGKSGNGAGRVRVSAGFWLCVGMISVIVYST